MPVRLIGRCQHCDAEIRADDRRDAATIPVLERAAKLWRLSCKACAAKGATGVDRDNPPDVKTKG